MATLVSLTALAAADVVVATDQLLINDDSANTDKRITLTALKTALTLDLDDNYTWTGTHDYSGATVTLPTITTLTATTANVTTVNLTGAFTLAENSYVLLDPALSADGKFTGIVIGGTAGATLVFGDAIYLDPTDSRWELADANAAAAADGDCRGLIGICVLAAAADADPTRILLFGNVRADAAFPSFTVGAPVYISETAGDVTSTAPTTTDAVTRVIGRALDANTLLVGDSGLWTTHT